MAHQTTFDITTPKAYFEDVVLMTYEQTRELRNKCNAAPYLVAITTAYHLIEWAFQSRIAGARGRDMICRALGTSRTDNLINYFDVARQITNGTKHVGPPPNPQTAGQGMTEVVRTFTEEFSDEFGPSLIVRVPKADGSGDEVITARDFLETLITFWRGCPEVG